MDLNTDSGMLSSHTAFEEDMLKQEPSLFRSHRQSESGGTILLQLLEFKTHLHEAVEELHIRRDAETRFEDQISQLVLEKQELEWEKESLQQQIKTTKSQHTESLATASKQFQIKLQHTEEEKGKYQVTAELKDKEINNLKVELKSLQLLKYNLEKKSSELEQKLALQSRTKDTHLNQLGEVEKRFSALSRQCTVVKQAHEKLEQNVDEAMKLNNKLISANQKQEEAIVSLQKELDGVSNKLIKEKMKHIINEKTHNPTGKEQHLQELQQKLSLETEMNQKLREDNVAERIEKKGLMSSLQHSQQLLLNQTQTVRRLERELRTQSDKFQTLKQEHEAMREKSETMEDQVVQLTESYAASRTSWDKEKTEFLDQLKSQQKDLQEVKEAYEDLQEKHAELSNQMGSQHVHEQKMREDTERLCVSNNQFPSMLQNIRGEETPKDLTSSPELPGFNSLQNPVSSQAKNSDHLSDSGAASRASGVQSDKYQDMLNHQQQLQHVLNHPNTLMHTSTEHFSLPDNSGAATEMEIFLEMSDLNVFNEGQSASNLECESLGGSAALLTKDTDEEKVSEQRRNDEEKQGKNIKLEDTNTNQENNKEEFQEKDVKDGKNGDKSTITAESRDVHEDTEGSAKAAEETSYPRTEERDKGEQKLTDGVTERGQTAEHTTEGSETQIPALTPADTTERSFTLQGSDFMDTELPPTVCESSNSSEHLSQKTTDKHADCNHSNSKYTVDRKEHDVCLDKHQRVISVPESDTKDVQPDEVQTLHQNPESLDNQSSPVCLNLEYKNPSEETTGDVSTECFEILKQSHTCSSQTQESNNVQECETSQTQNESCYPPHALANMEKTDGKLDACVSEECTLVSDVTEPQSQEASEQECVQLRSQVVDDEDERKECQSNDNTNVNKTCETVRLSAETLSLKAVTMEDTEVATGNPQEQIKTFPLHESLSLKVNKSETDLKLSAELSHEIKDSSNTSSSKDQCHQTLKQKRPNDSSESSLNSKKTSRSLFDWTAQRKTPSLRTNSDFSILQELTQGTHVSGRPPITTPMFTKTKHDKVPLVITRASDLFSSFSVSGAAGYSKSQQQEEKRREVKEETCRKTAAADKDRRSSLFFSSFPISSITSKKPELTSSECSKAASSAACPGFESDQELSCSREREDPQSAFRAHISRIEQFLNTERLHLSKRRRTDN